MFFEYLSFLISIANSHSLDDFICMTPGKGPGTVYSLQQFVYVFYKLPQTQINAENK